MLTFLLMSELNCDVELDICYAIPVAPPDVLPPRPPQSYVSNQYLNSYVNPSLLQLVVGVASLVYENFIKISPDDCPHWLASWDVVSSLAYLTYYSKHYS